MENTHLKDLMISDDCVLMRWTDDFLLITSSKDYAHTFLRKLITGFREYGCKINVKKSKTNLPADCCDELKVIERVNGSWFPWCNLLINVNTLQVRLSYKRYIGNTSMVITESLCHYGKINIPGSYSPLLLTVIFLHELELCIRPPGLIPNTTNWRRIHDAWYEVKFFDAARCSQFGMPHFLEECLQLLLTLYFYFLLILTFFGLKEEKSFNLLTADSVDWSGFHG